MEKFNFEKLCKEFGTSVSDVSLNYKELVEKFTPYYEASTGVNSCPLKTLEYYKLLAEISKVDLAYRFKEEQRLFISSNKFNITRLTEENNSKNAQKISDLKIELEQTIAGNFESERVKDALENYLACQEDLETEKLVVDIMKDDYNNYVELLIKNKSGECSKKEKSQLKKLIDKREVAYFQAKVHRLRMEKMQLNKIVNALLMLKKNYLKLNTQH